MITLKVGFPPGCPTQYCTVRADQNATVLETLTTIIKKQNLTNPDAFVLYYPEPHTGAPLWLNNKDSLGSYAIKPQDLLEVKKVSQIVTVSDTKKSMILLLDITLPLYELVAWIAVKLGIDDVDLANYSLYYNGKELNLAQSTIAQCNECSFSFIFAKKNEDQSSGNADQCVPNAESTYGDKEPSAAKLIASCQLHGQLKKQTTKKAWKQRYFILKDRNIFYFHSLQDRRPAGVIPLNSYEIKLANLQAKEAKYWALEFIYQNTKTVVATSPKQAKKQANIIIRFDNESDMHTWMAACKGEVARTVQRRAASKTIFGVPLPHTIPTGAQIPTIVDQCIKYIEERALDVVGIYRLSGSLVTIENWKKAFDRGERVDLSLEPDPHAVAGLLKLFLRELPEPLFTFVRYEQFIAAEYTWTRLRMLQELVWGLPSENQALLKVLLVHLRKVCEHSSVNKMQMPNLATVFGPTLLRAKAVNDGSGFDTAVLTMVNDTPVINSLAMHVMNAYEYIFCGKEIKEVHVYARAIYQFKGEDQATELSFDAGDLIKVTVINTDPNQWWMGEIGGRSGCFPGGYVTILHKDEQESITQIQQLTNDIESTRKHTQDTIVQVDEAIQTLLQLQKECASLSGITEQDKQLQIQATLHEPALFSGFQMQTQELYKKLSQDDSSLWSSLDKYQIKAVEDLDALSNTKYKPKMEKEGFYTKFDALKASIEQCKTRRSALKEDGNVILGDLVLLEKLMPNITV